MPQKINLPSIIGLNSKQSGVALIQVLLISTIISLLAIYFTQTARQQVENSRLFGFRVDSSLTLKSAQQQLIYTLLTNQSFTSVHESFDGGQKWNFYGQPFVLSNTSKGLVTASIQDHNGLLPIRYIRSNLWRRTLLNMGLSESEANRLQGEINDWQDKDSDSWVQGNSESTSLSNGSEIRNRAIQFSLEVAPFFEDIPQYLSDFYSMSTPFAVVGFNPMRAPDDLLYSFFDETTAQQIIYSRETDNLTRESMRNFIGTDYNDITYTLLPGSLYKIKVSVENEDVRLVETIDVMIQPHDKEPLLILSRY